MKSQLQYKLSTTKINKLVANYHYLLLGVHLLHDGRGHGGAELNVGDIVAVVKDEQVSECVYYSIILSGFSKEISTSSRFQQVWTNMDGLHVQSRPQIKNRILRGAGEVTGWA